MVMLHVLTAAAYLYNKDPAEDLPSPANAPSFDLQTSVDFEGVYSTCCVMTRLT